MSKVKTWSTTAASNNATPPDGWPENMLPSQVNNSARTMMAEIREVWNDKDVLKFMGLTQELYTEKY